MKKSALERAGHWVALLAICSGWVGLQLMATGSDGPTFDEKYYITSGLALLRTEGLKSDFVSFLGVLQTLTSAYRPDVHVPVEDEAWKKNEGDWVSTLVMWGGENDGDALLYRSRLPTIGLGVLLLGAVYLWAARLGGPLAGVLAAVLAALDPNLAAHSHLATTDTGLTALAFLAAYGWQRMLQHEGRRYLVMAGVALGAALASKLAAALFLPALLLSAAVVAGRSRGGWLRIATALILAALVVWGYFRFEVRPLTGSVLPIPAAGYFEILARRVGQGSLARPAFLAGRISGAGWWHYSIAAFLLKTPIPSLLGMAAGVVLFLRRPDWRREATLLIMPPVFFIEMLFIPHNLGYRLVLPVLPFGFVLAALGIRRLLQVWSVARPVVVAMGLWLAGSSVSIFPHYLAYFNEFAGGPKNGYRYLVDSNLDWGQDVRRLAAYVKEHSSEKVFISYFGSAWLPYYGIRDTNVETHPYFNAMLPKPGTYAISATHLQGIFVRDPDVFDWFRHVEPLDRLGYSILIYEVPDEPGTVEVCASPEPALVVDTGGFEGRAARVGYFDCSTSWILPGDSGPTWYVFRGGLPDEALWAIDAFGARLVFEQPHRSDRTQVISVYRLDGPAGRHVSAVGQAPTNAASFEMTAGAGETAEVAELVSAEVPRRAIAGSSAVVQTVWRVLRAPPEPLSAFIHVLDSDGNLIAGSDGMGVFALGWKPGDVFLQRGEPEIPPQVAPGDYTVRAGLYSWIDGVRLTTNGQDGLTLGKLTVRAP